MNTSSRYSSCSSIDEFERSTSSHKSLKGLSKLFHKANSAYHSLLSLDHSHKQHKEISPEEAIRRKEIARSIFDSRL